MHCILHIGMPKTGSKSLQMGLAEGPGYELLASHGIELPTIAEPGKWGNTNHTNFLYSAMVADQSPYQVELASLLGQTLDELEQKSAETVLISGVAVGEPVRTKEELSTLRQFLGRWFDQFRVVVYLREPRDYAGSRICQSVKEGYGLEESIQGLAFSRMDYVQWIARIRDVFSSAADEFCARSYDIQKLDQGNLALDFVRHGLQIDPGLEASHTLTVSPRNFSITSELVVLLETFRAQTGRQVSAWEQFGGFRPFANFYDEPWSGSHLRCEQVLEPADLEALDTCRERWNDLVEEDFFPSYQRDVPEIEPLPAIEKISPALIESVRGRLADIMTRIDPQSKADTQWGEDFLQFLSERLV